MDPGLELGNFKGFEEDSCAILNLNIVVSHKKNYFYHTENIKIQLFFLDLCDNSFFNTFSKFYVIGIFSLCDKEMKLCDKTFYSYSKSIGKPSLFSKALSILKPVQSKLTPNFSNIGIIKKCLIISVQ